MIGEIEQRKPAKNGVYNNLTDADTFFNKAKTIKIG